MKNNHFMAQVIFQYNGITTTIECQENQKIFEIFKNFLNESNLNENEANYFYDGKQISEFDKNSTFYEMANSFDKEKKKMDIIVLSNENENGKKLIKTKNIICPECGEKIKLKIRNYKIDLFECKNKHEINNILFSEFENIQMIDLTKIKCDECKESDITNSYNNEFYKCFQCKKNICELCLPKHEKNHNIINYDKIHCTCIKHGEPFKNYCSKCKKNLCPLCDKEHMNHNKILLNNMNLDKNEILIKLDNLKKSTNKFIDDINKIIEIINTVKINVQNFYKLSENIINNYNQNEKNYELLYNLNEIINNNIINDINHINNDNNINNKFKSIFNIYNLYNKRNSNINEIVLKVKIENKDINKKIYFLDNTDGNIIVEIKNDEEIKEEHHHDLLKELNESNVELYINNKKEKYRKYFIPDKEGIYVIKLKFNFLLTDCSCMFYNCGNIINLDLSSFNTQNVQNMSYMFYECKNIMNLDLSSFNTQNVKNMMSMFQGCEFLNLDLSSFNTHNATNMDYMFAWCHKFENLDLSSFNTENVNSMTSMFDQCFALKNINLSSFNTKNVKNMK